MITDKRFETYYNLLVQWNEKINLTAITEHEAVYQKHFQDSLLAVDYIPKNAKVIDIGTGAGFPAVPLMIARPDLKFTLVDSLNKRIVFLQQLLNELGLSASLIHARAEDLGRNKAHREGYDIALSRAVAQLPVLLELCVPLLRVGGSAICYKGDCEQELIDSKNASAVLGCQLDSVDVSRQWGRRTLVFAKKIKKTPSAYPRKAGTVQSKPL